MRDIDELRMDAQDMMEEMNQLRKMMEEMEALEDWMNGYSLCLCQHGVSQYHCCKQCEEEWERLQELHEGGE